MIRYLGAADLYEALPMADAIAALETAFRAAAVGAVTAPPRALLRQDVGGGRESLFVVMPASWEGRAYAAKLATLANHNAAVELPAIQGLAVLFDHEHGCPQLIVDAAALTTLRTGALVGLATRLLARADATSLGLIGTGALAHDMIRAVRAVRPIERVLLFNRTAARAEAVRARLDVSAEVLPNATAVAEGADILITATSSLDPVVARAAIRRGAHINAVGNFSPRGRELDGETVAECARFVDSFDVAFHEAGELLLAAEEGRIPAGRDGIAGELADLVTGAVPGREAGDQITLFKSVGTAVADVGALHAAAVGAAERGLGVELD